MLSYVFKTEHFFANPFLLKIHSIPPKEYTKPENLGFCYQPITMPSHITRQYHRRIKSPAKLL